MEPYNESAQLLTFSRGGSFSPGQVGDIAGQMEREFGRYQSQLSYYENSRRQNQQTKLTESRRAGEDLIALGQFSKTALDLGTNIVKRVNEANEIQETDEYYFGGLDAPSPNTTQQMDDEDEVLSLGEQQAEEGSRIASRAEQDTNSPEVGQTVQQGLTSGLPQAAVGDRARAMESAALLPSWMTSYLTSDATIEINGQNVPIRAAIASTDPGVRLAAQRQALGVFFQQTGLSNVSARNRVKYVVPVVRSTLASVGATLTSQVIKETRDAETARIDGLAFSTGVSTEADTSALQQSYNSLTSTYFTSNTGLSQGQANERATAQLLNGMVSQGDLDGIRALGGVKYNPKGGDEPSNTLRGRFPQLFADAETKATTGKDRARRARIQQLNQQLYRGLAQARTTGEKVAVIRQLQALARDEDLYEWADGIGDKVEDLTNTGDNTINAQVLSDEIKNGGITSVDQLQIARDVGQITPSQFATLESELANQQKGDLPTRGVLADVVKSETKAGLGDMGLALGLERDDTGNYAYVSGASVVTDGQWSVISGAYTRGLRGYAQELIRQNPNISSAELQGKLQEWRRKTGSQEGNFPYQPILDARLNQASGVYDVPAEVQSYWRNLANSPVLLNSSVPGSASGFPQTFTPGVKGEISQDTRNSFNPVRGDRVLTNEETRRYGDLWSSGTIDPRLVTIAQGLGMTPLALLNQQRKAANQPLLQPQSLQNNPYSNAIAAGLPANTAQFLAQRGLNIPLETLKGIDPNSETFAVLANPTSTPRQLGRATRSLYPGNAPAPTPQATATSQPSGGVLSQSSIQDVMRQAGWDESLIPEMSAVAMAESGGDSGIDTVKSGLDPQRRNEYSVGLFQINYAVHKPMLDQMGISEADLRNPLINAQVALRIYQMQGKRAWGAYTNGSYRSYM